MAEGRRSLTDLDRQYRRRPQPPRVRAITEDLIRQMQDGEHLGAWLLAASEEQGGEHDGIINMYVPAMLDRMGVTGIHAHVFDSTRFQRGGSGMRMEFGPAENRWSIRYEQGGRRGPDGVFILRDGHEREVGSVREDYGGSFQAVLREFSRIISAPATIRLGPPPELLNVGVDRLSILLEVSLDFINWLQVHRMAGGKRKTRKRRKSHRKRRRKSRRRKSRRRKTRQRKKRKKTRRTRRR